MHSCSLDEYVTGERKRCRNEKTFDMDILIPTTISRVTSTRITEARSSSMRALMN